MTLSAWRTAYASVAGTAHAASLTPCQDSGLAAVVRAPDGSEILIAAVADGAGSASCAAAGARLAVDSFAATFGAAAADDPALGFFDRDFVLDWLAALRRSLGRVAASQGGELAAYACTFLGAVVGAEVACFVQIGDGAIVVAGEDCAHRCIFWPQHGEFANSTCFVTQQDAADLIQVRREHERLCQVALFSDGMERLVLDWAARAVHGPALRPIFAWLAAAGDWAQAGDVLATYLNSAAVNRRTDDDKTLVMATRAIVR